MGAKKQSKQLTSFLESKANPQPTGLNSPRMVFMDTEALEEFEELKKDNNFNNPELINVLVDYILDKADRSKIEPDEEFTRIGARINRFTELKKLIDEKNISLSKIIRDVLKGKL